MSNTNKDNFSNILLESGTNEVEFMEFYLGGACYGVNVAKVTQVVVFDDLKVAKLPGGKGSHIVGTTMFRDQPILVVDLASFLEIQTEPKKENRLLLVLEFNQRITGFLIDGVNRIRRVSWEDFQETDASTVGSDTSWITGVVAWEEYLSLILDFEAILGNLIPSTSPENFQDDIVELEVSSRKALSIVYCEDSEIVQKVALKAFKKAGIENIKIFTSGKEGLDYLLANKGEPVDVIISDIEMPIMDGLSFCKKVKENASLSSIPVLFFSSTINEQMKKKCASVGGAAAFSKPQINELVASLDEVLKNM